MGFAVTMLLGFWPFTMPALLWWGLAASAPIIIHLWNRRRYNEMTWAAMEFLMAAMRKNSRRIRIEHLILLFIRTLILLLFAAALANPILSLFASLGGALGGGGDTHYVLVIDGSYSMEVQGESEETRFEVAQRLATEIVESGAQGDGFTLVLMAEPPTPVIAEPAFDPRDVVEEIANLRPRHAGAALEPTLAEVEKIVRQTAKANTRLKETRICFLSDLELRTWKDVDSPEVRARIGRLADKASLVLLDVGTDNRNNLAISHLAQLESLVTTGQGVEFTASVQNYGGNGQANAIEFLVDGQRIQRTPIDVPAGDSISVQYRHRFEVGGEHDVEVRLGDDSLAVDNHRWLSVPVREAIRVLCISGKPGAARNVAFALNPTGSNRARIQVETDVESALVERDLNQYDCLFICNVGRIGRDEANVLREYVRAGGGLAFFMGDLVQADSYNQELVQAAVEPALFPVTLGDVAEGEFVLQAAARHPINEAFAPVPGSGLFTIPSFRYLRMTPREGDAVRRIFDFDNGDPALVEMQVGKGRCLVFATAASMTSIDSSVTPAMPWTALPTVKDFVSLIQEMLPVLIGGREAGRNVLVGDTLAGALPGTVASEPLALETPGDRTERVRLDVNGQDSRWSYDDTWLSGIYRATYQQPRSRVEVFAVNIDSRESDPARFDRDLLPSQFQAEFTSDGADLPTLPTSKAQPFFRYLLMAVFVLLLCETLLAWKFGHSAAN